MPNREQHALALVVAGSVVMRFTKVAERDRPVYGSEYFGQQNFVWVTRQGVAAANSAFGVHQTGTF